MEIKSSPEKNQNTGEKEILISLSNSEIKWLKSCVHIYINRGFGDPDDPEQVKLGLTIKDGIHDCWKMLNPS